MGVVIPGRSDIKSAELEGVVIRCGCTPAEKERVFWHGKHGIPCPKPRLHEHLGVIASYHRNPLINWWRNLKLAMRARR
jgi:hypothetical protein